MKVLENCPKFEYFFLYYSQEHVFVHCINFKVKVEELAKVLGETIGKKISIKRESKSQQKTVKSQLYKQRVSHKSLCIHTSPQCLLIEVFSQTSGRDQSL